MGHRPSRLAAYVRLGRVSNLPTVWTNGLTAVALSGHDVTLAEISALCAAFSLFYIGGMFLNDAFDRRNDATARPERPIVAGHIGALEVFLVGLSWLAAGLGLLAIVGTARSVAGGVALVFTIVLYDAWHKRNPLAPFLMGLCRALLYPIGVVAFGGLVSLWTVWVSLGVCAYVMIISSVARKGASNGTVARLIAGISLFDAVVIAGCGAPGLGLLAILGYPLTLWGQRLVRGT